MKLDVIVVNWEATIGRPILAVGQKKGATLHVKKKEPMQAEILKKSKDFHGSMTDADLIKVLGIARNTYYKYKKELVEQLQKSEEQ